VGIRKVYTSWKREIKEGMTKKGLVFCNTCCRIVGDSFPVDHYHSFEVRNEMLEKNMNKLAFQFITDTKKNRAYLKKNFRPRNTVTLKL